MRDVGEIANERFGEAVAEIVGVGVSTDVREGEYGDGIRVGMAIKQQKSNDSHGEGGSGDDAGDLPMPMPRPTTGESGSSGSR